MGCIGERLHPRRDGHHLFASPQVLLDCHKCLEVGNFKVFCFVLLVWLLNLIMFPLEFVLSLKFLS